MSRRASSTIHPFWILGGLLLIAAAIGGGYLIHRFASDPFRALAPFDTKAYMQDASSLRGNVYKLNGTIDAKLAWSKQEGSLYSIEVDNNLVPLLVPKKFNYVNIQKGQRFFIHVEVGDKGLLLAQDIRRI